MIMKTLPTNPPHNTWMWVPNSENAPQTEDAVWISSYLVHHYQFTISSAASCFCHISSYISTFLETCEETQVAEEEKGKGCVATFDNFKMVVIHFPSLLHVVVSSSSQEM